MGGLCLPLVCLTRSCPFLVQHLASCIPAVGGVLCVFVVVTLLQTSFTDPGILPRATPDEAADIERQIGKSGRSLRLLTLDQLVLQVLLLSRE